MNQKEKEFLPILEIRSLFISYLQRSSGKIVEKPVIKNLSFALVAGQRLALLGRSGRGKSSVALALIGLLPNNARWKGEIVYEKRLLRDQKDFQSVRGCGIGIVFQQPHSYLNPIISVENQLKELLRIKRKLKDKALIDAEITKALSEVGLNESVRKRYPFQLSGGMAQRIAIAQTLILKPKVLIADEITASLDMSLRRDILDLLIRLQAEHNFALLFISHDEHAVDYIKAERLCL